MGKELRIDFQGVVAFVPDRTFAAQPTRVDVVLRDLAEPRLLADAQGVQHLIGSHHAWLEFSPPDRVHGPGEPQGLGEVTNGWKGTALGVLLLRREYVEIRPDDQDLPAHSVAIDQSVLDHLAAYQGTLKVPYQPNPDGSNEVAAAFPLTGGMLSVVEKTANPYQVPLANGTTQNTEVATTIRWTISFQNEVVLRFRKNPTKPRLRLRPAAGILQIAVRNRELDQMLNPALPAMGGQDDPEYLVYGDSVVGGQPQVLVSAIGPIPGGHKACGTGAIVP